MDALPDRGSGSISLVALGVLRAVETKTIEGHVGQIFGKLGLEAGADDHRRVLAVLAYLRSG